MVDPFEKSLEELLNPHHKNSYYHPSNKEEVLDPKLVILF
jgi:hypothetical protein